eukprot:902446-Prymnesium_polylepis.1
MRWVLASEGTIGEADGPSFLATQPGIASGVYGDFKTNATAPDAYTTSQSIAWRYSEYQKRLETLSISTVEPHTSL